ncbi:MAG: hypothetical protein AAB573_03190 [Patescibacteria group bacterium]
MNKEHELKLRPQDRTEFIKAARRLKRSFANSVDNTEGRFDALDREESRNPNLGSILERRKGAVLVARTTTSFEIDRAWENGRISSPTSHFLGRALDKWAEKSVKQVAKKLH